VFKFQLDRACFHKKARGKWKRKREENRAFAVTIEQKRAPFAYTKAVMRLMMPVV